MGSGGSKSRATPTILKGYSREQTAVTVKVPENAAPSEKSKDADNKNTDVKDKTLDEMKSEEKSGQVETLDKDFIRKTVGFCHSKWPIRCYGRLNMNVNAHYGGGAALYLVSCAYGGKGEETTAQVILVRSGFDCNYVQLMSICTDKEGHFGCANSGLSDEDGVFVGDCMFGNNHLMILPNDNVIGNLRCGSFIEARSDVKEVGLPVNVNGVPGAPSGGMGLLLCTSMDSGTLTHALYMIRCGFKNNKYKVKLIQGEDKYKLSTDNTGNLRVATLGEENRFALFHNYQTSTSTLAYVAQTQSLNGKTREVLLDNLSRHIVIVVICSNSKGFEDSTVAAVYYLAICDGNLTSCQHVSGCHGKSYKDSKLWNFSVASGQLIVEGPKGPCKYGILTNMKATKQDLMASIKQTSCLGSGEDTKTIGKVKVTKEEVTGEVNKSTDISIMFNHKIVATIASTELKKAGDVYKFAHKWTAEEKVIGFHMVRVFALRKHVVSGQEVQIELQGSPYALTYQKPGVTYALSCAGPAYQAISDIVYSSEFKQFASFSYETCFGTRCKARGKAVAAAKLAAMMLNSHDGFLHVQNRGPFTEADDEKQMTYQVDNIPNGNYTLRIHLTNKPNVLQYNNKDISNKVGKKIDAIKIAKDLAGPRSYVVDIDVSVTDGQFSIYSNHSAIGAQMSGFALMDKTYVEKTKSPTQLEAEEKEKATLADTIKSLVTTATKKKLKIVGWSPNLLQNASGAEGMKHWNTSGDTIVTEGGHGTDKRFQTSHMWCEKYQEINLLEHFTAEHLDTSPDIHVLEYYHEGICGGGYYCMTVTLLGEDGKKIDTFTTGQIGKVYNKTWLKAEHTFSGYKSGVRMVGFSSKGKDDKYWGGHYGILMCGAEVRVKRKAEPAADDAFEDLKIEESTESNVVDKLVSKLLADNQELLQSRLMEDDSAKDQNLENQPIMLKRSTIAKPKAKKKREIRVFVSSTFRDFTQEREEIIKKAFREVNKICGDRGVFFTYVDLRWGITSEQTSHGKTISICLQEIDRCRPYFICLMGERFGWCQREEKPDEVLNMTYDYALENNPNLKWIEKYRYDTSVTQLEIFHGVLNNVEAAKDRSFFYFRDPPIKEELSEDDYKRRVAESEWHQEQVNEIKDQIKKHTELHTATFKTASEVAEMIKEDLKKSIDEDFPLGTQLTKLEQQREAHNAFASVRCRVYIGREEYFTQINNFRKKKINQPFVLLGESGSGKSALVANWCKRVEEKERDTFLFVHFIGSSSDSANYMKLLRRLFEEMKIFFNIEMSIPSSDTLLINELPKWLRIAGSRSNVVVVMDALNQLDDGSGKDGAEHDLLWIPSVLPPNVFMLLSTLPGRTLTAVESYTWPTMPVSPLQDGDKMQIIEDYLTGIYGKTLNAEQKDMIVNAPQTSNPLFLKSLLDEVRMFGSFRQLTSKIQEYLKADMPSELFAKILERLEADFESGEDYRDKLVHDATTALWCSNKGMAESELIEMLGVPSAIWSPFFLSLYESLVNRDGLLNFFHDHLRQAVESKYLSTAEQKKQGYLALANFFSEKETSDRTVEELPFLLTKAGELDRLKSCVRDLEVFKRLSDSEDGSFELVKAWNTLGGFSVAEEAYMEEVNALSTETILSNPDHYFNIFSKLGDFFRELGLIESSKTVYVTLIKQLETLYGESHGTIVYNPFNHTRQYKCKHPDVIKNLQNLGQAYVQLGKFDQAEAVFKDAIGRQNRVEMPSQEIQLCEGLLGLSQCEIEKKDMAEAKKQMMRALELASSVLGRKHHFVASIYSKLGQLSYQQSRLEEALVFFLQDLRATRGEFGTRHPSVAVVLNELGLVYDDQNDEKAGELYEAALMIIIETYGNNFLGTGVIRFNLGMFYIGRNYFAKARFQFEESYKIHASFLGEDHPDTKNIKEAITMCN